MPPRAVWVSLICLPALFSCSSAPAPRQLPPKTCTPRCERTVGCGALNQELLKAQKFFYRCISEQAPKGHLSQTHKCYRSLRLLESARWWLKTLTTPEDQLKVYQPSSVILRQFLCAIERLAAARDSAEVERLYLDMVRHYP